MGTFFYKAYATRKTYLDARATCESDGAFLAFPRTPAENEFIGNLMPEDHIWLGFNDLGEEGEWMREDGLPITRYHFDWPLWAAGQPDDHNPAHRPDSHLGADGVVLTRIDQNTRMQWYDSPTSLSYHFVCFYRL